MKPFACCALLCASMMLFAASAFAAEADWFYTSSDALIAINITGAISADDSVHDATVRLLLVPFNSTQQETTQLASMPAALWDWTPGNASATFHWQRPKEETFSVQSTVRTRRAHLGVIERIAYPQDVPSDLEAYGAESDYVRITPAIRAQASALAQGQTDAFIVAAKIAGWVEENIRYNLSSLNVQATKDSAWVMEHKEGVCDELTVLYVAMLRSIGIPARFISGISFTNDASVPEGYGPHAWAEVWLGQWVPVDVVYKEIGFVDAGHIKLAESADKRGSAEYAWQSVGKGELRTYPLDITLALLKRGDPVTSGLRIFAEPLERSVSLDSAQGYLVTITNPNDYYMSDVVSASDTEGISFAEERIYITLKPKEQRTVFFRSSPTKMLTPGYTYTFPVAFSLSDGARATASFASQAGGTHLSLEELSGYPAEEEGRTALVRVSFSCDNRQEYFLYEHATLRCVVTNAGNSILENVTVCIAGACNQTTLYLSQGVPVSMPIALHAGRHNTTLQIRYGSIVRDHTVSYAVKEKPTLLIENLSYPNTVAYGEPVQFNVTIIQESRMQNVRMHIRLARIDEEAVLTEERIALRYVLPSSSLLRSTQGRIIVTYEDEYGNPFEESATIALQVVPSDPWEGFLLWLNRFF